MNSELLVLVGLLFGNGGLAVYVLRREATRSDRADDAYIKARNDAAAEFRKELAEVKAEFRAELERRDREHSADISALEEHIARLHRAITKIVPLVAQEHVAEVTAVLVELGMPIPPTREEPT